MNDSGKDKNSTIGEDNIKAQHERKFHWKVIHHSWIFWILSPMPSARCVSKLKSFVRSVICQVIRDAIAARISNNTNRQITGASPFGILFFSIQLQNGKKRVAKIPAILSGIRNTRA